VEIEVELTEQDLQAFADYQVRFSPRVRAAIRRIRIAYLIAGLLLALGFWMTERSTPMPLMLALVAVILFAVAPWLYRIRLRRHFSRAFRDPANRMKYRKRRLRITDDGLVDSSELAESVIKWAAVVRVDRTPSHGFLYLASDVALIVPRHAVGSEAFDQFMAQSAALSKRAAA